MNKKICAVTIADEANMKFYSMLKNSWDKFHPDIELKLVSGEALKNRLKKDPYLFYRFTPIIGAELLKEGYETVVKIDSDSIITADLTHTWEGTFDVAVVQNSNPREMRTYPVSVWDIPPMAYVNCGYVVMKSKGFVDHWLELCMSGHFNNYQFKEQDLLNILTFYGGYDVKFLDSGDKFHGLACKGYWQNIELRDKKLILPQNGEWPQSGDKEIDIIHFAGGNDPTKGHYGTRFQEDVVKHLDYLTRP